MAKFSCKTCLGTWASPDRFGIAYYHACAPVSADSGATYTERSKKLDENIVVAADGTKSIVNAGNGKDIVP